MSGGQNSCLLQAVAVVIQSLIEVALYSSQ